MHPLDGTDTYDALGMSESHAESRRKICFARGWDWDKMRLLTEWEWAELMRVSRKDFENVATAKS